MLREQFFSDPSRTHDLSMVVPPDQFQSRNITATCSWDLGFRNRSRLCHACRAGHRREGLNKCSKCPDDVQNVALIVLGVLFIIAAIVFIAGTAIKSAGKQDLSESIQKILINYLQVATLAKSFPLRWPSALQGLFDFQGAISTVGDHLVNPDCIAAATSDAELFYAKQLGFAMAPFVTVLVSFLFWLTYSMVKGPWFFKKRSNIPVAHGETRLPTPKDKFVVTVGALLYLIFPTLINQAFNMFDCKNIGGHLYLQASLEERCYTGRHAAMVVLLGVSQFAAFVVGLPVLLLFFLKRNRTKLQMHAVLSRYGLFYGAYKEERYYWELVIVARKIFIVGK